MKLADSARRLVGQAGLLLGWRPQDFWQATPDELASAFAALADTVPTSAQPPDRAMLDRLTEMYPDE